MTTRRRTAALLTAAPLIAALLTACGSHSASTRTAAPATPAATTTAAAPSLAPSSPAQPAVADPAAAAQADTLMVLDDYERDGAAVKTGTAKKANPDGVAQFFTDAAAAAKFHGGGGVGAPVGCGAASGKTVVDGAVIGTPVASGATLSVPVSLYTGPKQAAQLTVTADAATGKLKDFSCGPAAAPDLPGAQTLVGYYGGVAALAGDPAADSKDDALKGQFLAAGFAKFTRPDVEADQSTCAEDTMTYWHAVYAPKATKTGAQWYFQTGGPGQVNMSVAVDTAASRVSWVYCFGQLLPVMGPGDYSDSQVQSYIGDLFNDYAYLLSLKPYGADVSGMADYFASDAAYQAAVKGTGAQPLECSQTAAVSMGADDVAATGKTAVVSLSSSPSGHPVAGGRVLGHPKVTVDLTTMKITGVTCG